MTKPDWAERKAERAYQMNHLVCGDFTKEWIKESANLLRAERRRVVRVIQRLREHEEIIGASRGYLKACDDLLAAIKGR